MTNHLRCLLLNLARIEQPDYPGEEYVPEAFSPVTLTREVDKVYSALFGVGSDRAMRNVRLAQLMPLLHYCELEPYVLQLDSRITYKPFDDQKLWRGITFGAASRQDSGDPSTLYLAGPSSTLYSNTSLYQQWRIEVTSGSALQITRLTSPGGSVVKSYTITSGWSELIPLPGSSLSFQFSTPGGDLPVFAVNSLLQPKRTLPEVLASMRLAGVDAFMAGGSPQSDFRKLWYKPEMSFVYQLGVAVLALGYKINSLYGGE